MKKQGVLFLFSIFFSLLVNSSFAAAFQAYELASPIIGTAAVGQAITPDASIAYFNPAAMAQLNGTSYLVGTQFILPYINFSKNSLTTILGDNGANAGSLLPSGALYYVYSYSPSLKLGLSFNSPYGGMLNYNDGWAGRFIVQNLQMYALDLNPSFAYQLSDWAAIGAGFTIEYANLMQTLALPTRVRLVDGQANLNVSNTNVGFNVGLFLIPWEGTKIGLAYRSKISHDLEGTTTFYRIDVVPITSMQMIMPQTFIASIAEDFSDQLTLLAEAGWANWAQMKDTIVNIRNITLVIPQDWHDTYRVGLGAKYSVTPDFTLQSGASFDSSPTSASKRLPDLPMDRQIRVGLGFLYNIIRPVQLGFSYEYINFGKAPIHNQSIVGTLSGDYWRNFANVFQASINVNC